MDCGKIVISLREQEKISRHKLAGISGIPNSTIQNWEEGKADPTVENFNKALNALGYELAVQKIKEDT